MENNNGAFLLDPDYYSASIYVEEEERSQYLHMLLKILIAGLIIVNMVLLYMYLAKYNDFEFSRFFIKESSINFVEKEKSVKNMEFEPTKVEVVEVNEVVQSDSVPKNVQKVVPTIKPKIVTGSELSDEYIKQVKESLGNY